MPPLHADVIPVLNQRMADQVADQLGRMGADAGRDGAASFNRTFSDGLGGLRSIGADAGGQLRAGLRTGIDDAVSDFTRGFGAMGDVANTAYAGISRGAGLAAVGIAGIGVAAVAVGQQLYDLGSTWDDIGDGISIRTGKMGDELGRITGIVRDLGAETAAPLESIGDIAGRVSQALGLTGNDLREVTQNIANLSQMTGEMLDIRDWGKASRIFDIADNEQVAALNSLFNASQATGASVNELVTSMTTAGKSATQFGLGFGETAALLSSFEQAGVDINRIAPAMTIALRNFANAGREPQQALRDTITEIKNLSDAGRDFEATALASETFGRGFIDFLNAIKDGSLDANGLTKALESVGPTIDEQRDATADWSEEWDVLKNKMSGVFAPAAEYVFGQVNRHLSDAGSVLSIFSDSIRGLGPAWEQTAAAISGNPIRANIVTGAFTMGPNGQIVPTTGPAPGANPFAGQGAGPGAQTPTSLDSFLGIPPPGPPPAPAAGQWWPGAMVPEPDNPRFGWPYNNDDKSGPRLPPAPSVPYAPLPGLAPGLTMTAGLFSAQSGVADAETRAAEKQARLNQLRATNAATADEIQNAENDALQAQRAAEAARMRFAEAQQSAFEQQYKQMDKMSADLESFGAQIDDDFGASEGLAGIAENITKFIANLAFAPAYGALAAVREANGFGQGEAGSGLVGALGASGALGDQYRAVPRWARGDQGGAADVIGPAAALQPGMATGGVSVPAGQPYGLPAGTDTGGYGSSGAVFPQWVHALENAFGVKASTYSGHQESDRNEAGYAPNPNHENRGIDWSGSPQAMQAFADYLKTVPGMEQVIWNGAGVGTGDTVEIAGGRPQPGYFASDLAGHGNHVHTRQSSPIPLPGMPTGAPLAPPPAPTPPRLAPPTSPIAGAMQAASGVGTPIGPTDLSGVPSLAGGPLGTGVPSGLPIPRGAAPSQSATGGRAHAQGMPASPGIGIGGGVLGMLGSAVSSAAGAAGTAAGMGMDGGAGGAVASAVADMGIQQLQRAAAAGGQYVGALVGGLIETGSLNGSALGDPSSSWFGRIAAAVPGVRPALPNSAGMLGGEQNPNMAEAGKPPGPMEQPPGPLTPEQASAGKAADQAGGGTINNSQTNNVTLAPDPNRNVDGQMRDVNTALSNQNFAKITGSR